MKKIVMQIKWLFEKKIKGEKKFDEREYRLAINNIEFSK